MLTAALVDQNKSADSMEVSDSLKRLGYAKSLWWERYRPQRIEDMCLPNVLKNAFIEIVKTDLPGNLLFYGPPGTGKTTLMNILIKQRSVVQINASIERGIDTIRNKIISFGSVSSMLDKSKIIALDEVDQMTPDGQLALRGAIESIAKTTKFIATCNYIDKLDSAIRSRFQDINFAFSGDARTEVIVQKAERIKFICADNGISITSKALAHLLQKHDDLRAIIDALQQAHDIYLGDEKVIKLEHVERIDVDTYAELYMKILDEQSDLAKIRQFIVKNYAKQELRIIDSLGDKFVQWLSDKSETTQNVAAVYVLSHKYSTESRHAADPITSMMALISEIRHILT